jgi:hypothetical protein
LEDNVTHVNCFDINSSNFISTKPSESIVHVPHLTVGKPGAKLELLLMLGVSDPNLVVGEIASVGLAIVFLWRFFAWVSKVPTTPDPWGEEIERKLYEPDAVEVCHRCFSPQPPTAWFCEHCGNAVGPYNNWMPYVNIFSEGEVLRNGLVHKFRAGPFIIFGYLLYSLGAYLIFAPIYWYYLFKHLRQDDSQTPGDES